MNEALVQKEILKMLNGFDIAQIHYILEHIKFIVDTKSILDYTKLED